MYFVEELSCFIAIQLQIGYHLTKLSRDVKGHF